MPDFGSLSLSTVIALFVGAAVVIAALGTRMARIADILADRTGLGEALVGSVLLGAGTSISGIVTSVSTAHAGFAELAVSNAIGGIAAQTMFLVLADIAYRRVNLEHAAADAVNLTQANLLILLMLMPMLAHVLPNVAVAGVHPLTPLMIGAYILGLHNAHSVRKSPMWIPKQTPETRDEDEAEKDDDRTTMRLAVSFAGLVVVVGAAGYVVGQAGVRISGEFGLSQSIVGALLTAVVTSLPELVTTVAAVRRGALQLAVGGIVGGNMFDALFVSASDIAYREGSVYHAFGDRTLFWFVLVLLMTALLLMGLLRRQREGPAGIGWESVLLMTLWAGGAALQVSLG